jgi:protein gp37
MSKIEWTHRPGTTSAVLNPTTGCDKISRGCKFCYAETMHKRLRGMGQRKYQQPFLGVVQFWPDELAKPFKWRKPRTVFLDSMSDIFHKNIKVKEIAMIYAMMFLTQWHTYIVLTKRSERAKNVLKSDEFWLHYVEAVNNLPYESDCSTVVWSSEDLKERWPLPNVWQGVSCEGPDQTDRLRDLAYTPARIRVASLEPLVGPVDLNETLFRSKYNGSYPFPKLPDRHRTKLIDNLDWVIVGGESGAKKGVTPVHPDWVRQIRDQVKAAGKAFFFKQWGKYLPLGQQDKDGELLISFVLKKFPFYTASTDKTKDKYTGTITGGEVSCISIKKPHSGNLLDGKQHLEFPTIK